MINKRLQGQRWRRRNDFGVDCNASRKYAKRRKIRWPKLYTRVKAGSRNGRTD